MEAFEVMRLAQEAHPVDLLARIAWVDCTLSGPKREDRPAWREAHEVLSASAPAGTDLIRAYLDAAREAADVVPSSGDPFDSRLSRVLDYIEVALDHLSECDRLEQAEGQAARQLGWALARVTRPRLE